MLKDQLTKYLFDHKDWCPKAVLLNTKFKNPKDFTYYLSSNVDRTLRLLEEQSIIAVKKDPNSKSIVYKWIPHDKRERYIPTSKRLSDQLFEKV